MATIPEGIDCLTNPGDIVYIYSGPYTVVASTMRTAIANMPSGTGWADAERVRVVGFPGQTVTLNCPLGEGCIDITGNGTQYISFENLNLVGAGNIEAVSGGGVNITQLGASPPHHIKFVNVSSRQTGNSCAGFNDFRAHHIWWTGGTLTDCGSYGIYNSTDDSIFENIIISFTGQNGSGNNYAVHSFDTGRTPSRNTFRNLTVVNSGAILLSGGTDNVAYNNTLRSPNLGSTPCFQAASGATRSKFYNNTCDGYAFALDYFNNNESPTIINNIFSNISGQHLRDLGNNTGALVQQYNLSIAGSNLSTSVADHNVTYTALQTARLADVANGDMRPCTGAGAPHASCISASLAIGAGTDLSTIFTTDAAGSMRVAPWTIGAHGPGSGVILPACPATPALVASWGFDGNGTDDSGNGNDATLGSGLTYTSGKYGQSLVFNGTAAATVADSLSQYLCTGWTISGSVFPTSAPSGFLGLVTKDYTNAGPFAYASSTGQSVAGSPLFGYQQSGAQVTANYSTLFTQNVWTDFAFTYDNTLPSANLKIWINGVVATTANGTATIDRSTGLLYIGGSVFGEFLPSGWKIDEVRIYNHARTSTEINADRNTAINPAVPGVDPVVMLRLPASATGLKLAASATAFKVSGGMPTTSSVLLLEGGGTDCLLLEGGGTDCLALEQ